MHDSKLETLESRVEERIIGPCRVLMLKTPVRAVVSWRGSLQSFPDFAAGEELIQGLTVGLLDKGTRRRDRFAIAEILENRGAQLSFSSEGLRVAFQGRALQGDLSEVLAVMAEQLREPLFDAAEFEKEKAQYAASLHRSLEHTASQASGALSRLIYPLAHPNYTPPTEESLARLSALTVEQVRQYHADHFGANQLLLVLIGDVNPDAIEETIASVFEGWLPHNTLPAMEITTAQGPTGRSEVPMPDKRNVDVRMGHGVRVRRQDPDYVPLYLGNYILGGNFSARLMTRVRGEMGLTYGINSVLSGITTEYEGHWQVGVTLSQENVQTGIDATMGEVRRFVDKGVTEEEVRDKQTTITGSFKVGMATTGGLATTIHLNATRGFNVAYLDRFTAEVEAATHAQINEAIARHLDPDAFQFALAGMVDGQ